MFWENSVNFLSSYFPLLSTYIILNKFNSDRHVTESNGPFSLLIFLEPSIIIHNVNHWKDSLPLYSMTPCSPDFPPCYLDTHYYPLLFFYPNLNFRVSQGLFLKLLAFLLLILFLGALLMSMASITIYIFLTP